jgi:cytochrome oxidase Cu insertion factor (SCO1/SenC/PrrC family)/uncharacterized membrane protein YozB (DUF420 family)
MPRTPAGRAAAWAAGLLCLTCLTSCQRAPSGGGVEDVVFPLPDFTLTERSGREVRKSDLAGKVWVASFIFTRCTGPCPHVTATMARLQDDFAGDPDVRLVTFTVDPEHDTPEVLRKYADGHGADPERWLFLTGPEADVYGLLGKKGFMVGAEKNTDADATPGTAVTHDTHLAVVDQRGRIRGYFSGKAEQSDPESVADYEQGLRRLREEVTALRGEPFFPPLNAALNAAAGVLLLLGYGAIRRRWVAVHVGCMLSALAVSAVFLASYLYYHIAVRHGAPTRFADQWPYAPEWVAWTYYAVLASHTVLAAVTAPLAPCTAYLGLRGRWPRHVWLARRTLPIWLYVSATGVVVYWMLYRLY